MEFGFDEDGRIIPVSCTPLDLLEFIQENADALDELGMTDNEFHFLLTYATSLKDLLP